ncbi:MAG: class I SAM-dependent methyltransferase [Candidatus Omnitrophota bacterium]|nr:class I SAM-dependent methyltransferase [Candidatus Omnitrophota bacterium]
MLMNLEEYYKDPVTESWTYVAMGMENLKDYDPGRYTQIKEIQALLLPEQNEVAAYIKENSARLGWDWPQIELYTGEFLQKFPLALRKEVVWDDPSFIFLYLLVKLTKPRVVIETGSNIGFSSTFIALAVKENNNDCKFYTIDPYLDYAWKDTSFYERSLLFKQRINPAKISGRCPPLAIVPDDLKEYILLKNGYSRDVLPGLLQEHKAIDIFFHDSDHSYQNKVWECSSVLPQIPHQGYILVHDINQNSAFSQMFGKNGGLAIKEHLGVFKKTDQNYIIDGNWSLPLNNSLLNDQEYESKEIDLKSSPKNIIIQLGGPCDLHCVFCPGRINGEEFSFDNFYRKLEGKISRYLAQAERIVFKSCGNLFNSAEVQRMIDWRANCIELSFPEVEKIYFTNGFDLTQKVLDFIVHPRGICFWRYSVKNTVNILLYASNSRMYKTLTRSDDFCLILKRVEDLVKFRKNRESLKINLMFYASTLNIEDLPEFVRLAANLGVDKVECSYNYIYVPGQKYLSCFFKQKMTNEILEKSGNLANQLKLEVSLPPKFGQLNYPDASCCRRGWDQLILSAKGEILTCDLGISCPENLQENCFMDGWNGPDYQDLRKNLCAGAGCFKYCFIANPACVNDFRAHVIQWGRKDSDIDILWGDNF